MRAVAVAAVLLSTVALAQRGGRAPSVLWVDGPIYSWNERQRADVDARLKEAGDRIDEALRSREHRGPARRDLELAEDAVDDVRGLLAGEKKLKVVPARKDEKKRGYMRAVKTSEVAVISMGDVIDELREADEALANVEDAYRGPPRGARDVNEARDLLYEVHETLLATVDRTDRWQRRTRREPAPDPVVTTPSHGQPPPPPHNNPMSAQTRDAFFRALEAERTAEGRLRILEDASRAHRFLVADVEQVLKKFDRPMYRLRAVYVLRSRIIDTNNTFSLYAAFSSGRDKDELKRLLSTNPASFSIEVLAADQFQRMLRRVTDARTDDEALADVSEEAGRSYFRADQVASLIASFSSSMLKMKAVQSLAPHVVDPENYAVIQAKFNSSLDRNAVRDLFVMR